MSGVKHKAKKNDAGRLARQSGRSIEAGGPWVQRPANDTVHQVAEVTDDAGHQAAEVVAGAARGVGKGAGAVRGKARRARSLRSMIR